VYVCCLFVQSKLRVVMTERFMFGFWSVFVIYPDGHGGTRSVIVTAL